MLLGLLVRQLAKPSARDAGPRIPVARTHPEAPNAVLRAITETIAKHGPEALTHSEKLIWNTAVVISFMTGDCRIAVPSDARVLSWGAARAGFNEMGFPALAELVRLFVLELAYRADLNVQNGTANSASLLRIAVLKQSFQASEGDIDFPREVEQLICRVYEWA
ncbi:hypothetical protein [Sphingopyxis sp. RIFCSPHIGHO2_12_FULL_65_19]|jgi:hypothetical protein|uniref:hypothetical protein n=1 Tax=Sphingopyxis sp. RIFCSPHIGHO2_12_FULL_65_19 TaxID=1802172 RepID=UPI0008BFD942|nr:hypothetical protein [Sphingopyxis sp. RIFCSPHIGHO2_12_FULL_65_19]OHD06253.1 MAG: hypothetical protein A3E77_13065 [Sphingopyxis sp. RIFCSPHIGHO2_12_FULL_65_19]